MKKADAIDHFGSPSKLAKALGITIQAIGQWGDTVPRSRQYELEVLTAGALRADTSQRKPRAPRAQRA
ncbi:Cro/CI family transcriptional regulator [Halomonas koreensis]|uniref:Cro/CI family transcriptional regulator n=1 Tax=Halomonas koreensis TaxID=245385 RepID=A0ABU1G3K0_9GAMM|nr:Cro/CI family transcriptional regulator [Halomonas koreensis]MDR5867271.1 Cro/CI family transcriptional regulator [Halomonas koreensis]